MTAAKKSVDVPVVVSSDPEPRTVSWTVSKTLNIGHHSCGVCEERTPGPTTEEVIAFAKKSSPSTYWMWAGTDWMPAGWRSIPGTGLLCPPCGAAIDKALAARRKR